MRQGRLIALVVGLMLFSAAPVAQAAPSELDPGFGTGGLVVSDLGGEDLVSDAAADAAGRVVAVGWTERANQTESEAVVVRYTASGALDPSFGGGDGIVTLHFGVESFDSLSSVLVDPSGRIVVAGTTASDISCSTYCHGVVARFTESGQLDPTFGGGDGVVTIAGNDTGVQSLALDGSGRILAGTGTAVYRFTESGSLDPTFGTGGAAPVIGTFAGLAVDGSGRIVAGEFFAVERLLASGKPDPAFGNEGVAHLEVAPGSSDSADAIAVDESNRVVVSGQTLLPEGEANQPFILRLTEAGVVDPTFGEAGRIIGGQEGRLGDLAVDSQGRYLAVGYNDELAAESDVLIRYLPNGSLDPAFGGLGFVTVPLAARSVATDPAERIVVGGVGGELDFGVARFLGADAPAPGPEPDPTPGPGPGITPGPVPPPAPHARRCRRGFVKRKVHGKTRCVKKHHRHRRW